MIEILVSIASDGAKVKINYQMRGSPGGCPEEEKEVGRMVLDAVKQSLVDLGKSVGEAKIFERQVRPL